MDLYFYTQLYAQNLWIIKMISVCKKCSGFNDKKCSECKGLGYIKLEDLLKSMLVQSNNKKQLNEKRA